MAPLVGQTQLRAPSILQSMQTGGLIRGETQRQERLRQSDINKMRLQRLAEEKQARDLATSQRAMGVSAMPSMDEDTETSQRRLIAENPELGKQILDSVGIHTQQGYEDASKFVHKVRGETTEEGKVRRITDRIADLESQGRNASDTMTLLDPNDPTRINPSLTPEQLDSALVNLDEAALTAWQRAQLRSKAAAKDAKDDGRIKKVKAEKFRDDGTVQVLYTDGSVAVLTPEDAEKAKKASYFEAGVAAYEAAAKESRTSAVKQGVEAYKSLAPVNKNIENIEDAIRLVDSGAETGPIDRLLPTLRASTMELENVRSKMGLDIIAVTTFGALSESELEFALDSAMPIGLNSVELRAWLVRKKEAQTKYRDVLEEAAQYLTNPRNTIEGFTRKKRKERKAIERAKKAAEAKARKEAMKKDKAKGAARFNVEVLK